MTSALKSGNLFDDAGAAANAEDFRVLLETAGARIERIVSHSHSSPPGFWYDQEDDEWVMIVRGTAALEFADGEIVEMKDGDYLLIPRRTRHRVARTSENTIWLAIHLR